MFISEKEVACMLAGAATAGVIMSLKPPLSQGIAVATLALSSKLPIDLFKYAFASYTSSVIGLLSYKIVKLYTK